MAILRRVIEGLRSVLQKKQVERELDDELRQYLQTATEQKVSAGMSHDEAQRAARLELGSVESVKDQVREVGWEYAVETLWRDVRHGTRLLWKSPRFTITAILTLALGIGATTAIFSVVSAVLWQPLPYPNAARIVQIIENVPAEESMSGRAMRLPSMNPEEFDWWRHNAKTLSHMAMIAPETCTIMTGDGTVQLTGQRVSPALFPLRGIEPVLGRWLNADEEKPGANAVVLNIATWRRYFGSDPNIVGRTMVSDGQSYTIVGVMPAAFDEQAFWMPLVAGPPKPGSVQFVRVTFLLKDGVSTTDAAAEVNALGAQLRGGPSEPGRPPRFEVVRELDQMVATVRPALRLLVVAVVVVLLIVCANVANLLMVRGAGRHREIGIRLALGAGRFRVVRQLLTEGIVLSLAGGAVGVVLAYAGVLLVRTGSVIDIPSRFRLALGPLGATILPRADQVAVDPAVLAFAFGLSLLTGVIFGLAPALRLSRANYRQAIGVAELATRARGRKSNRAGHLLAVVQLALATTLLIGSGLLLRSFINLSTVFVGFDPDAQIFQLVSPRDYSRARKMALAYEVGARLRTLPGVEAAGFINQPPLRTSDSGNLYLPPEFEAQRTTLGTEDRTVVQGISPDYLRALGVRLLEGRWLDERDAPGQPRVMLVNRAWVQRFSPGKSPIGTTVSFLTRGRTQRFVTWEVVGVIENIRWRIDNGFEMQQRPAVPLLGFMGLGQLVSESLFTRDLEQPGNMELDMYVGEPGGMEFAIRSKGDPIALAALRNAAREVDPAVAVDGVTTMGDVFSGLIGRPRFYAVVISLFGGIAALIAAIGIYGVLAYAMTQRTQEFGIRMALGAERRQVLALVLRQGVLMILIGIPAGIAGALALTRYLQTILFGVTPVDTATYVIVAIAFAAVALLASYVPARRATRVDPLTALRYD